MKKLHLFLILLLCIFHAYRTHAQSWQWMQGARDGYSMGQYVATDLNGNVYDAFIQFGRTELGPYTIPTVFGECNTGLVKYDSLGNISWLLYISCVHGSFPTGLATDLFGNEYLIGTYYDSILSFGGRILPNPNWPGDTSMTSACFFIAKINAAGSVLWLKNFGNANSGNLEKGDDIITDQCGNIYVACPYDNHTVTLGTDSFRNAGKLNFLVAKLDSSGSFIWAKSFGGNNIVFPAGIKISAWGDIFIAGNFSSDTLQFGATSLTDTSTLMPKNYNIFVARLDNSGNAVWAKTNKGSASCFVSGEGFAIDQAGNAFITGSYQNNFMYPHPPESLSFDVFTLPDVPGLDSSGLDKYGYITKYDSTGNVSWVKGMRGSNVYGLSATIDQCQNIWIFGTLSRGDASVYTGTPVDTIDGHTLSVPVGSCNISAATFLAVWGNAGTFMSEYTLPTGYSEVNAISLGTACDRGGNMYITGVSPLDTFVLAGDTVFSSCSSGGDMFIAKYSPSFGCPYGMPLVCHLDTIADARICTGATATLSDGVHGGRWTSSNTAIATIDSLTGTATGISDGTATVTYSFAGDYVTTTVTVNSIPPRAITGDSVLCEGTEVTLLDTTSGAVWISSNTLVATIGSLTGMVTGITGGTAVISYSFGGVCSVTKHVTVHPLPNPGVISGPDSICIGNSAGLSETVSGGLWNTANGDATVFYGTVSGIMAGIDTVFYTVTNPCGTATTSFPLYICGDIYTSFDGTLCPGTSMTLADSTPGGVWVSSNTSIATVGSNTGIVTGVAAGVVVISYLYGDGYKTEILTVNPMPVAGTISGIDSLCPGDSATLSHSLPGGVWASNNHSVSTVNGSGIVTGIVPGADTIFYMVFNSCGVAIDSLPFTVDPCTAGVHTVSNAGGEVSIHPNPVNGELILQMDMGAYNSFTITNTFGQTLIQQQINATQTTVDVQKLSAGVYYITLRGDNGTKVVQFVKM